MKFGGSKVEERIHVAGCSAAIFTKRIQTLYRPANEFRHFISLVIRDLTK